MEGAYNPSIHLFLTIKLNSTPLLDVFQPYKMARRSGYEQEVADYAAVMETVFEQANDIPLTVNYIKQLHTQLLQYSEKDAQHLGEYKTLSDSIEAFTPEGESIGTIFQTASPFDTPRLMDELIA
jgi:hypothetical protein